MHSLIISVLYKAYLLESKVKSYTFHI